METQYYGLKENKNVIELSTEFKMFIEQIKKDNKTDYVEIRQFIITKTGNSFLLSYIVVIKHGN